MRTYKFRGKSILTNKWVEGDFITDVREFNRSCDKAYILPHWDKLNAPIAVVPESVSQFTGLKDEDGTDIYEGHICEKDDKVYQIIWIDRLAKLCAKVIKSETVLVRNMSFPLQQYVIEGTLNCSLKVIGNIYENPELVTA